MTNDKLLSELQRMMTTLEAVTLDTFDDTHPTHLSAVRRAARTVSEELERVVALTFDK